MSKKKKIKKITKNKNKHKSETSNISFKINKKVFNDIKEFSKSMNFLNDEVSLYKQIISNVYINIRAVTFGLKDDLGLREPRLNISICDSDLSDINYKDGIISFQISRKNMYRICKKILMDIDCQYVYPDLVEYMGKENGI